MFQKRPEDWVQLVKNILNYIVEVEHSHVRFLGNVVLNIWDCGGQVGFMNNYLTKQAQNVFSEVQILIYVFDVESREYEKDLDYFKKTISAISHYSKDVKVFCLLHKMDLIEPEDREELFRNREKILKENASPLSVTCIQTSIWDETLYKAWSTIVYAIIPNIKKLETSLDRFCKLTDADEVVLFERTSFLVIAQSVKVEHPDPHRLEKISNIVKQFKLCCSKNESQFQSLEIRHSGFLAFLENLTSNSYILILIRDTSTGKFI